MGHSTEEDDDDAGGVDGGRSRTYKVKCLCDDKYFPRGYTYITQWKFSTAMKTRSSASQDYTECMHCRGKQCQSERGVCMGDGVGGNGAAEGQLGNASKDADTHLSQTPTLAVLGELGAVQTRVSLPRIVYPLARLIFHSEFGCEGS